MRAPRALAVAALGAALLLAADGPMGRRLAAFPPLSQVPPTPFSTQDAGFAAAGMRAAAADLAWIQLLQYLANSLPAMHDDSGERYDALLTLSQRVVRLDPSFHRAYLYGASILGWFPEVNRPDQAVELLQEGMRRDPGQKRYSLLLAALAYKRSGDSSKMVALLEGSLDDPSTPGLVKAILANYYKAQGKYAQALALWVRVLDDPGEASMHPRARLQIADLERLSRAKRRAQ
jgi:tetratricopeptide (TPR) repeat protein